MSSALATVNKDAHIEVEGPEDQDPKVMIVEDDESTLRLIKKNLERIRDYRIETVSNPRKALKKIDCSYDCMVSDYEMPEMDGIELLREIKSRQDLPFILYTGKGSEEIASKAISEGVDNYLRKEAGIDHFKMLAKQIDNNVSKKKTEEALNQALTQYKKLLDSSPVPIYVTRNGKVLYTNKEGLKLSKYQSIDEIKGEQIMSYIAPEDREKVKKNIQEVYEGEGDGKTTFRYRNKNGKEGILEARSSIIHFDGEKALQSSFRDITEEKKVKKQLRDRTFQLEGLLKSLPIGVISTNRDRIVSFVNSRLIEIFDLDRSVPEIEGLKEEKIIDLLARKAKNEESFRERIKSMRRSEENERREEAELENGKKIEGKLRKVEEDQNSWNIWTARVIQE